MSKKGISMTVTIILIGTAATLRNFRDRHPRWSKIR